MGTGRIALVVVATAVMFGLLSTADFQQAGSIAAGAVVPGHSSARDSPAHGRLLVAHPVLACALSRIDLVASFTPRVASKARSAVAAMVPSAGTSGCATC